MKMLTPIKRDISLYITDPRRSVTYSRVLRRIYLSALNFLQDHPQALFSSSQLGVPLEARLQVEQWQRLPFMQPYFNSQLSKITDQNTTPNATDPTGMATGGKRVTVGTIKEVAAAIFNLASVEGTAYSQEEIARRYSMDYRHDISRKGLPPLVIRRKGLIGFFRRGEIDQSLWLKAIDELVRQKRILLIDAEGKRFQRYVQTTHLEITRSEIGIAISKSNTLQELFSLFEDKLKQVFPHIRFYVVEKYRFTDDSRQTYALMPIDEVGTDLTRLPDYLARIVDKSGPQHRVFSKEFKEGIALLSSKSTGGSYLACDITSKSVDDPIFTYGLTETERNGILVSLDGLMQQVLLRAEQIAKEKRFSATLKIERASSLPSQNQQVLQTRAGQPSSLQMLAHADPTGFTYLNIPPQHITRVDRNRGEQDFYIEFIGGGPSGLRDTLMNNFDRAVYDVTTIITDSLKERTENTDEAGSNKIAQVARSYLEEGLIFR